MILTQLRRYAGLAYSLPFKVFAAKVARRLRSGLKATFSRGLDRLRSTYESPPGDLSGGALAQRCTPVVGFLTACQIDAIREIGAHYLEHRFDLLGSGWMQVRHGMECTGLEGHRYPQQKSIAADVQGSWLRGRICRSNLQVAQSIWSLVTPDYVPIDWHMDFKSGYRWDEKTWYRDIRFGFLPGVDVKVPWELARMQHLPQLAHAYALAANGAEGFMPPGDYAQEFQNQVLDFIASNPPRYGVNWACTMDVGIRIANWLMARDLFVASGAKLDDAFEKILLQSVYQHGRHIIDNLEWRAELRGNHYLSDIVGLLFVASYLPCSDEVDAWLAFSIQELIVEVKNQFYEDGGNFEASTSYHRLSAELVVYATALVVGLPEPKRSALGGYDCDLIRGEPRLDQAPLALFTIPGSNIQSPIPEWYWNRLEKMAEFVWHTTRPDHLVPQVGDNDSGRLFKLQPLYESLTVATAKELYLNLTEYVGLSNHEMYLREEHRDHRHLVAAVNGFFLRNDFSNFYQGFEMETYLVRALTGGCSVSPMGPRVFTKKQEETNLVETPSQQTYRFAAPTLSGTSLVDGLWAYAYPDFGFYLYKSKRLYLAIRCGPIGLNGLGAHAHNDQLSIELWLDGQPIVVDGGSYIYTALPARRDEFRSIEAHFSPRIEGRESGDLMLNIFQLGNEAQAKCSHFSDVEFVGYYQLDDGRIYRKIVVDADGVRVFDWAVGAAGLLVQLDSAGLPYSSGYGWRFRNTGGVTL